MRRPQAGGEMNYALEYVPCAVLKNVIQLLVLTGGPATFFSQAD